MKKNIRFVSAAAAALLAVAPVVASAVPVNAASVVTGSTPGAASEAKTDQPTLTFTSSIGNQDLQKAGFDGFVDLKGFSLSDFTSESNLKKTLGVTSSVKSDSPSVVGVNNAKITAENTNGSAALNQNDLEAGKTYYLQAEITINGLNKDYQKYESNVTLPEQTSGKGEGVPTNQGTMRNIKIAVPVHFYNSELSDQPSFGSTYLKNNALANNQTIEAPTSYKNSEGKTVKYDFSKQSDVYAALKQLGLSSNRSSYATGDQNDSNNVINYSTALTANNFYKYSNSIDAPSSGRTVVNSFATGFTNNTGAYKFNDTYTLKRINIFSGKTATLNVAFSQKNSYPAYPLIKYTANGDGTTVKVMQGLNNFDNAMPIAKVKLGNSNWAEDLLNKFTAEESSNNSNKLRLTTSDLHVDDMNINQSGLYNATLTATNANGLKTTLNFQVAVSGDKKDEMANYFVSAENGEVVNLVSIVNGSVSNQNGVVANNGQQIVVYPNDTQTVGDTEYTRVASVGKTREASNLWIPTKNLKAAVEKKAEKTGTVTVMHNAYVYTFDKDGKKSRVGSEKIATYSERDVYGTKTVDGKKYYKISADKEEYIDAGNVDGTKRVLKHNAYIYATSKKRASKKVLKKGESVTTYGSAVKFKNGKAYYRIEGCTASNKMYVKKANF